MFRPQRSAPTTSRLSIISRQSKQAGCSATASFRTRSSLCDIINSRLGPKRVASHIIMASINQNQNQKRHAFPAPRGRDIIQRRRASAVLPKEETLLKPPNVNLPFPPFEKRKKDMMDAFSPEFSRDLLNLPSFGDSQHFNDDMVMAFTPKEELAPSLRKKTARRSTWHCDDNALGQVVCQESREPEERERVPKDLTAPMFPIFLVENKVRSAVSWIKSPPISRPTLQMLRGQESLFASINNLNMLDKLTALPRADQESRPVTRRGGMIDLPSFGEGLNLLDDGMSLPIGFEDQEKTNGHIGRGDPLRGLMKPRSQDEADNDLPRPRLHTVCSGEESDETMASIFESSGFAPRVAAPPPTPLLPEGAPRPVFGRSESVSTEDAWSAALEVSDQWQNATNSGSFTSRDSFTAHSRGSFARQSSLSRRLSSSCISLAMEDALGRPTILGHSESVTTVEAENAAREARGFYHRSRSSMISRQDTVGTMATVNSDGSSDSDDDDRSMGEWKGKGFTSQQVEIDVGLAAFERGSPSMFASPKPKTAKDMMKNAFAAATEAASGAVKHRSVQDETSKYVCQRKGAIMRSDFQVSPGRCAQDYITPDSNREIITGFGESRQRNLLCLPKLSNGSSTLNLRTMNAAWRKSLTGCELPSCTTDETQESVGIDELLEMSMDIDAFVVS
jgi:hypothetical protein